MLLPIGMAKILFFPYLLSYVITVSIKPIVTIITECRSGDFTGVFLFALLAAAFAPEHCDSTSYHGIRSYKQKVIKIHEDWFIYDLNSSITSFLYLVLLDPLVRISNSKMPYDKPNRALAIVDKAAANGYAVVATCCYNLEGIIATVRAAEAKKSPAIVQLFPWAIEYADGLLLHAAKEAADKATVPVAVHMDHAQSPEIIKRAADLGGFDGIMVDMSHYEKEENMAKTKELVEYLHARGIITEAEPGRINGGEVNNYTFRYA